MLNMDKMPKAKNNVGEQRRATLVYKGQCDLCVCVCGYSSSGGFGGDIIVSWY